MSLPDSLQEELFPPGACWHQYGCPEGGPVYPRNVDLHDLEVRLLEAVQREPWLDAIELCPMPYSRDEHERVASQGSLHAIVLADGSPALQARDELFGSLFGAPWDGVPGALQGIEVAYDLGLSEPALSATESAAVSLAQGRYSLTMLGARRGALRVRLAESEAAALAAAHGSGAEAALQAAVAEGGALRPCLLEGLRLFGLPEQATAAAVGLRAATPPAAWHAQLRDCTVPDGGNALPHPLAFPLGDAAGMASLRPGGELSAALRGARSLVQQLATVQHCLAEGWPVDEQMLADHGRQMAALQAEEALCPRRPVVEGRGAGKGRGAAQERSFFAALESTCARLAAGWMPPEQAEELGTDSSLRRKVSSCGLSADTLQLLGRTGAWPLRQMPDATPFRSQGAVAEVAQGGGDDPKAPSGSGGAGRGDGPSPRSLYNQGVRLLKAGGRDGEALSADAFLRAAQEGHREAQYAVGVMFLQGRGVQKNQRQALRWMTAAAEQNHPKAQYNLGLMRQYGVGSPPDLPAASAWMSYAARQGHGRALQSPTLVTFGVGDCLDYDPEKLGPERVLAEAERGNRNAQYRAGAMLYEGQGVEPDKAQASFWFMQAAQQGLAEAQYQISRMLFFGDGVEKDEAYALRFLALAAEQGHMEAQHNLGVKLYFGEGVGVDRPAAARWFLKAAKQGFPQSQSNVGWMLVTGDGMEQDIEQGRAWLEDAAGRGNLEAQMHLTSLQGNVLGL